MKTPALPLMLMTLSFTAWAAPAEGGGGSAAPSGITSPGISREASRSPTPGSAERFTGKVQIVNLFAGTPPARVTGGQVRFAAGARTAWHTHPLGQTLIVTAGSGRIQFWGGQLQEMKTGDVVSIPPGVKHWHGASPGSAMTHIAIQEHAEGQTAEWLEKVSDEQYGISAAQPQARQANTPSRAQQLLGDVSPKLAELTDDVLFGDIWARQGLSRRDRSLATVSALIALNRPEQLRSHLALALQNGLSREEIAEAITHLAFYAGWPSAVSAVAVAKEVLPPQ
jgi:4-carboxymuconolactone decarboxylase